MLGIPTMKDRAMQAIWQQALDPVAEVLSDPFSHGFRKLRSCWDAREHFHRLFAAACRARWVLDADIEKCFDKLSHEWLLKNIPLPKRVLSGWLRYPLRNVCHCDGRSPLCPFPLRNLGQLMDEADP